MVYGSTFILHLLFLIILFLTGSIYPRQVAPAVYLDHIQHYGRADRLAKRMRMRESGGGRGRKERLLCPADSLLHVHVYIGAVRRA